MEQELGPPPVGGPLDFAYPAYPISKLLAMSPMFNRNLCIILR